MKSQGGDGMGPADSEVSGGPGLSMSWRRLLCFPDREAEAAFVQELARTKRQTTLWFFMVAEVFYVFEFYMSDGFTGILDSRTAARVMYVGRVVTFLIVVALNLLVWFKRASLELATISTCSVIAVSLFTGNTYRMSILFGGTIFQEYQASCDAAICYDDTMLVLALMGSTTVMVFAAVRVSRSLVPVVLSVALFALGSSFGLGPNRDADMLKICFLYATLAGMIWFRSYVHERDVRRQWLDNRLLRLKVDHQRQLFEEQQRWLRDVNERLDALQYQMATPAPVKGAPCPDALDTTYLVPDPPRRPVERRGTQSATLAAEPNSALVERLAGRRGNPKLVRQIAERIRDPDYSMRSYFEDCVEAFPELDLFYVAEVAGRPANEVRDGQVEYQRTFGAMFAVYWILRLDIDGKLGFSFGCDEQWDVRRSAAGTSYLKKEDFLHSMDWALLRNVADTALGNSVERVEAMLCLTAFHDIMKVPVLVPRVLASHAPYQTYTAGDTIHDHDIALAYVLEYYPHVLPSFAALPESMREVVLFSQTKMSFNHGWFVQAEGPPGAMLSALKRVLDNASGADLAFYFVHWLTDFSGAEGTPLAGAEKFTLKFPMAVLISFLWSMPYLERLVTQTETEVMEHYLEARFVQAFPDEPLPSGDGAVATLRLAVMAQRVAHLAVDAFREAPVGVRRVLSEEMALTGIDGQAFRRSPTRGGPAFLVYYGPAVLQRCKSQVEMDKALCALAAVYSAGRRLWPWDPDRGSKTITLEVGRLRAVDIENALDGTMVAEPCVWALVRQNDSEAKLELLSASELTRLVNDGMAFVFVDLRCSSPPIAAGVEEFVALSCGIDFSKAVKALEASAVEGGVEYLNFARHLQCSP